MAMTGFRVLEIQETPNPNAVKVVLDRPATDQPTSFLSPAAAIGHPLAGKLFKIKGVAAVLLLGDFITINKSHEAKWADIIAKARAILEAD